MTWDNPPEQKQMFVSNDLRMYELNVKVNGDILECIHILVCIFLSQIKKKLHAFFFRFKAKNMIFDIFLKIWLNLIEWKKMK